MKKYLYGKYLNIKAAARKKMLLFFLKRIEKLGLNGNIRNV